MEGQGHERTGGHKRAAWRDHRGQGEDSREMRMGGRERPGPVGLKTHLRVWSSW